MSAQDKPIHILHYKVINGDTLFVERITPSKCYSRLPRQKGKEWRKYHRLVHNFAKTYPYALAAKKILMSVDSTVVADGLVRGKRDKYITQVQKDDHQPRSLADETRQQRDRQDLVQDHKGL